MTISGRKSVLLVTVDCLRADHAGFMGYARATTPFLDSLAGESFVFPAAITGGAPTYYSFPSILASRYPLALGRDQLGLAPGEPSLASALKDAGYATAAFCAGNPYLSKRFGYDQGFDCFQDFLVSDVAALTNASPESTGNRWRGALNRTLSTWTHHLGPLGTIYDEMYFQYCQRWATSGAGSLDELRRFPAADVLVREALAWLAGVGDGPFFLWLHFMDPHSPYYPTEKGIALMGDPPPNPFRARYLNSFWNRADIGAQRLARYHNEIVQLYDAGVRWVDEQLSSLVAGLRKLKQWDDCIFSFTADHGEEFLDHGGRYHPPDGLNEELIHVPLLLRAPGTIAKALPKSPFSHLHLAPTLLDAAGVPAPAAFQGHSFWPQLCAGQDWTDTAISECVAGCTNPFRTESRMGQRVLAVREARYKLILHFNPPQEWLFDLDVDPGERSPLPAVAEKATRRRMLEIARDHLQGSTAKRDLQAVVRTRLRELQLEWAASVPEKQLVAS